MFDDESDSNETSETEDTPEEKDTETPGELPKTPCHGCDGKGWVAPDAKAQTCPICKGEGQLPVK